MAIAPRHSRRPNIDVWPGFVDALSQLVMVIIFILLVFTAGQFYLSAALSGRNQALQKLQQQVNQLADLLSLERSKSSQLAAGSAELSMQLKSVIAERDELKGQVAELTGKADEAAALRSRAAALESELAAERQKVAAAQGAAAAAGTQATQSAQALAGQKKISSQALAEVERLNQQIAALRQQLTSIAQALDLAQAKVKTQETQIKDLGQKLNLALVSKVKELARYRSEFFGRLRSIIGDRPGIRIVGDRFVFQSEVLFAPGSAELSADAKKALDPVIAALKQIAIEIPPGIGWILRVDGHTDDRPIHTAQFPSNWELSTARALAVVRYAISQGISADHLAATGFGDTQPIDPNNTPEAWAKNRRIELRLTDR